MRIRSLFILLSGLLFGLITARCVLQLRLVREEMADCDSRLASIAFERYQQDLTRQALWLAALTGVVLIAFGILERRSSERASALARELAEQRETLAASRAEDRALREELARANEDLQARNEELQAQEEELRAQSEELTAGQGELELRNEELGRASRLKSDFLASMSHELRTPLNAVIGFSDLLLAGDYGALDPAQEPVIRDVLGAGHQLLTLINDVLDLSKIEAGRVEVSAVPIDIAATAAQASKLLASAAARKSVRIVNRVPEGVLFAAADPDRLRQVVVNLLSNAVKFTPEGGSVIIEAAAENGRVRLSVIDTGIGIAAADVPKLFVPFTQIDSGYARRFQGTGLGLSICKDLVERLGGTLSVDSSVGKGSLFRISFPELVESVSSRGAEVAERTRAVEQPAPVAPRSRVLVVDDEPRLCAIMARLLGSDHDVTTLTSAATAVERIAAGERFDVIFSDLMMPGMSGMELHAELERLAPQQAKRMVFLTGGAFTPRASEFLGKVRNRFLDKPFDYAALSALAQEYAVMKDE